LEVQRRARRSTRARALGAACLLVLLATLALRMGTEPVPPLRIQRTLAAYVRLAGTPPALAWPREGEAAVEVPGVGSFGISGGSRPASIASVAKVMTAYLTLRQYPLGAGGSGFTLIVTPAEVAEEGERVELGESTVPVRAGERLSERQALQALLLPSANNVAAMLAVHDAGTIGVFVARMNATARALGMGATTYTDPSGFEASTVSTAADQLKLARAVMGEPAFAAIVDQRAARLPVAGRVVNIDGLVGEDGYVGIKTGSDDAAGGCLMFAKRVSVDHRRLTVLGVVLGQRAGALVPAALASAQRLGDSAAAALRMRTALPVGSRVLDVSFPGGGRTAVVTGASLQEIGWAGLRVPIAVSTARPPSRLHAGERLATVAVEAGEGDAGKAVAVAAHALGGPSLGWRLRHLL
jgi:serine-type D-Ala-D-Ala carboxypeptidase (penicillin-binding protein 5/6)